MSIPSPAASAAPLHLYDYTHGQRQLTLWREPYLMGRLAVYAALAVPVTDQAPGEPPKTRWVEVARGRSYQATLVHQCMTLTNGVRLPTQTYRLELDATEFVLYREEALAIAAYLGIDASRIIDERTCE